MKSHYFFEKRKGHLYMTVSGEYDFEDFKTYLKIVYAKCEEEGIYKMIIDALDVAGIDIPTMERYFLGVEAAQELKYKVKLAIIWHKEYINHFGEMVAQNRGGNISVNGTVETALKWLLSDDTD